MINLFSIRPRGFNIGNEVIHLGINHFIRNAFKKNYNVISIPATGKYESQKKSGITPQTVYEINQFGDGVIVGGGNLYENGELEINATALQALEKPLMIFSVSRGKIYNNKLQLVDRTDVMTDENITLLNNKALISISRDNATLEHLSKLGLNNLVGGCPTLFINEIPQHLVPLLDTDKTDALISIRNPTLMSIPLYKQYEIRQQLIELIELLKKKGYDNIKFLCHDHRDIPFAASFKEIEYIYTEDVFTYLTYLRNTKLNLTYRLHSFLPCLAYKIPTIKISYDLRALSTLETIGLDAWNINLLKDNVIDEVGIRLSNLDELNSIKLNAQDTWQTLRKVIVNSCENFAEIVYSEI